MKRIVDGVTYNTQTSRLLARAVLRAVWPDDESVEHTLELYQTRGGAFFLLDRWLQEVWIERQERAEHRERSELEAMSAEQAQRWMLENDIEVIDNPFGDPPEATAEEESGSTVYVRVPPSLKRTIDQEAGKVKLSTNMWAMRCMERCLSDSAEGKKAISLAWNFAKTLTAEAEEAGRKFESDDLLRAISDIEDSLENCVRALWGTDDFTKISEVGDSYELREFSSRYCPGRQLMSSKSARVEIDEAPR
jgi:predicted HicB family RNase H-like nuclease